LNREVDLPQPFIGGELKLRPLVQKPVRALRPHLLGEREIPNGLRGYWMKEPVMTQPELFK
jgi:hypothetical protein